MRKRRRRRVEEEVRRRLGNNNNCTLGHGEETPSPWARCRRMLSMPIFVMVHVGRRPFARMVHELTLTKDD
eukprot:9214379-Pyramimonas_sp.AAC.1